MFSPYADLGCFRVDPTVARASHFVLLFFINHTCVRWCYWHIRVKFRRPEYTRHVRPNVAEQAAVSALLSDFTLLLTCGLLNFQRCNLWLDFRLMRGQWYFRVFINNLGQNGGLLLLLWLFNYFDAFLMNPYDTIDHFILPGSALLDRSVDNRRGLPLRLRFKRRTWLPLQQVVIGRFLFFPLLTWFLEPGRR